MSEPMTDAELYQMVRDANPEDVPRLVAEVRRLRAQNADLRAIARLQHETILIATDAIERDWPKEP